MAGKVLQVGQSGHQAADVVDPLPDVDNLAVSEDRDLRRVIQASALDADLNRALNAPFLD
jgi:hypothetical protein